MDGKSGNPSVSGSHGRRATSPGSHAGETTSSGPSTSGMQDTDRNKTASGE